MVSRRAATAHSTRLRLAAPFSDAIGKGIRPVPGSHDREVERPHADQRCMQVRHKYAREDDAGDYCRAYRTGRPIPSPRRPKTQHGSDQQYAE